MADADERADTAVQVWAPQPARYTGQSWASLEEDAYYLAGADLEKGDQMIGVPFMILGLTFRPGSYLRAGTEVNGDYVSIELLTGPQHQIDKAVRRGRMTADQAAWFDPEERLVINEAGTGAYRQLVSQLETWGWIVLPDGPADGRLGDSRFDTPVSSWQLNPEIGEVRISSSGYPTVAYSVRIVCPRGLRSSDYENEYTKTGHTRYIA